MKTLVVFYSSTNNTKYIAEIIAKQLQADLLAIKPKKKLPPKGFMRFFLGGASTIFKMKPKLVNSAVDLNSYQNIIIGTLIWAGSYASPIHTFIKQNKIEGKKIALFACHASKEENAAQKCFIQLKKELSGNTCVSGQDFLDQSINTTENNEAKALRWAKDLQF